jgi:hypothetical protein
LAQLDATIRRPMAELGFARRGRVFRADLGDDWDGWVRVDITRSAGALFVSDQVAALHLPWAAWWEEHLGHRPVVTFERRQVVDGTGLPRELADEEQAEWYGAQLADAARTDMLPWMREVATVDALLDPGSWTLDGGTGTFAEAAVAAALVGRRDLARQRLDEAILAIDDDFPLPADRLRANIALVADRFDLGIEVPAPAPDRPATGRGTVPIHATAATVRLDLHHFGEDELAERARHLSDDDLELIAQAAGRWAFDHGVRLLAKAVALGAVEVLEGAPRDLARSARRPRDSRPPP